MIISFVIPVYNTEKYLKKCICSILNQEIDKSLFEIILIDDGSTDNSARIIADFACDYDCIKPIYTVNQGLGKARNIGIDLARGKYIFFVDSDDYILDDSLGKLIEIAKTQVYDIIGFDWNMVYSDGKTLKKRRKQDLYNVSVSGSAYLNSFNLSGGVWSYLFSATLLKEKPVRMPEEIFYEDELFMPEAFTFANRVLFIDHTVYAYLQRNDSITHKKDQDSIDKKFKDCFYVLDALLNLLNQKNLSKIQQNGLKRKIAFFIVDIIINLICFRADKILIDHIVREIKKRKLYPMVKERYGFKYKTFRLFFNYKNNIVLASKTGFFSKK